MKYNQKALKTNNKTKQQQKTKSIINKINVMIRKLLHVSFISNMIQKKQNKKQYKKIMFMLDINRVGFFVSNMIPHSKSKNLQPLFHISPQG